MTSPAGLVWSAGLGSGTATVLFEVVWISSVAAAPASEAALSTVVAVAALSATVSVSGAMPCSFFTMSLTAAVFKALQGPDRAYRLAVDRDADGAEFDVQTEAVEDRFADRGDRDLVAVFIGVLVRAPVGGAGGEQIAGRSRAPSDGTGQEC
ncbi:hypothetical protein [Mycobacterium sp. DL99]|uniref:hypothetical protein n=1 Tax=Mycobacterium sp. DL99 TaxID=2528957 RepID=UPI0010811376|nr:hypothetical protein [Mycobacterium sp. DL99]